MFLGTGTLYLVFSSQTTTEGKIHTHRRVPKDRRRSCRVGSSFLSVIPQPCSQTDDRGESEETKRRAVTDRQTPILSYSPPSSTPTPGMNTRSQRRRLNLSVRHRCWVGRDRVPSSSFSCFPNQVSRERTTPVSGTGDGDLGGRSRIWPHLLKERTVGMGTWDFQRT